MLWAAVAGRALGLLVMALLGWQILDRELDFNSTTGPQFLGRLTFGLGIVIIMIALGILANETYRAWQRASRA